MGRGRKEQRRQDRQARRGAHGNGAVSHPWREQRLQSHSRVQVYPDEAPERRRRLRADFHHAFRVRGRVSLRHRDWPESLQQHFPLDPRQNEVPPSPYGIQSPCPGLPDRRRGRARRRGDLPGQVRPHQGTVPLGPQRQEGRQKFLLGSGRELLGRPKTGERFTFRASVRR